MSAPLSVCILSVGDDAALALSIGAAVGLGAIVVGLIDGECAPDDADVVVTMPLGAGLGEAWDRLLRAAPTDQCLMLHPGELKVAGDASSSAPAECIVIDQPGPFSMRDRLGTIRLVDRTVVRLDGRLSPRLELKRDATSSSLVILDAGSVVGDAYKGWLQHLGVAMDDSDDPEEIIELATMLAGTGEHDAAVFRISDIIEALDGDQARRAARLAALSALHRGRPSETWRAVERWAALAACPGPALAVKGLYLAQQQRMTAAVDLLERAVEAGLTDEDGISVDRLWVESALSDAKLRAKRLEGVVGTELAALKGERVGESSLERMRPGWVGLGLSLGKLYELLKTDRRRRFVERVFLPTDDCEPDEAIDLAASLAASNAPNVPVELVGLVHRLASRGELPLDTAVAWTARFRHANVSDASPLQVLALSPATSPVTKVLAGALELDRFDAGEGEVLLSQAAHGVHSCALAGTLRRLVEMAPKGVLPFLEAAGTTTARRALLADVLDRAGAPELAEHLRAK